MSFSARIGIAILGGVGFGLAAGPAAAPLGEAGKLIIQVIKVLAAPLLFFAVVDAFVRTHVGWRSGLRMVAVSAVNAAVALVIGLGISNLLQPGTSLSLGAVPPAAAGGAPLKPITWIDELAGFLPKSIVQPFAEGAIIPLILLAVLGGLALRRVREGSGASAGPEDAAVRRGADVMADGVSAGFVVFQRMLGWVILWVPLAVFGVVAKTVGAQGFAPLKGLGVYLAVALLGLVLHVGVTYQLWIVLRSGRGRRIGLRQFWKGAREAVVYALGASSSLATLPVTLACLDRMGVSKSSARLSAGVGTNLNNDGILLYEAMAVLFVAQAHGIDLSLGQQLAAAAACLAASIGIAGIPDAGLISLSLVLATVGLPVEAVPLLLTVDWIVSRARATTNVISDMVGAVVLDSFEDEAA